MQASLFDSHMYLTPWHPLSHGRFPLHPYRLPQSYCIGTACISFFVNVQYCEGFPGLWCWGHALALVRNGSQTTTAKTRHKHSRRQQLKERGRFWCRGSRDAQTPRRSVPQPQSPGAPRKARQSKSPAAMAQQLEDIHIYIYRNK